MPCLWITQCNFNYSTAVILFMTNVKFSKKLHENCFLELSTLELQFYARKWKRRRGLLASVSQYDRLYQNNLVLQKYLVCNGNVFC